MKDKSLRLFLALALFFLFHNLSFVTSAHAQGKALPHQATLNATLDDSERPTRLEMMNSDSNAKETVRFSFAPAESRTFPFNGQTFSAEDGVTITQMFQRNSKLDLAFSYTIGDKTLALSVERLSEPNPTTNRIRLLPVKMSIKFNGSSATFVFTGRESEEELATKLQDFFAVGRSAQSAGFDKASDRIAAFTKKLWVSFAGGDEKRSALPLRASFPVTEMTFNIFALSFAMQNQAFEKFRLCQDPKTLHQSLMVIAGVKEPKPTDEAGVSKASHAKGTNSKDTNAPSPLLQELELEGRLCCALCEIVHCAIDAHWADCFCCIFSCTSCLPYISSAR